MSQTFLNSNKWYKLLVTWKGVLEHTSVYAKLDTVAHILWQKLSYFERERYLAERLPCNSGSCWHGFESEPLTVDCCSHCWAK